jgi:hypothetical protein
MDRINRINRINSMGSDPIERGLTHSRPQAGEVEDRESIGKAASGGERIHPSA